MQVKLISVTPDSEKVIGYCARVSNPKNQDNPNVTKLLKYCWDNGHVSIFSMATMCVEVETSRAVSHQILRHWSMYFHELDAQEFSQRYAEVQGFEPVTPRRQDTKDRQNSVDDLDNDSKEWFVNNMKYLTDYAQTLYEIALQKGIAKECARFFLPECAISKFYLSGNLRNWITYLNLRTGHGTQLEHQEVAKAIQEIFKKEFPIISQAIGWVNDNSASS